MIARKLFARLTDAFEELLNAVDNHADPQRIRDLMRALGEIEEEVGWPWKASQEQLDEWNSKWRGEE